MTDPETAAVERSNLVERTAEAIAHATLYFPAPLGTDAWHNFWQSIGIPGRQVYRKQADVALKASELEAKVAKLQAAIDGIREADLRWRDTSMGVCMAWPTIRSIIARLDEEN